MLSIKIRFSGHDCLNIMFHQETQFVFSLLGVSSRRDSSFLAVSYWGIHNILPSSYFCKRITATKIVLLRDNATRLCLQRKVCFDVSVNDVRKSTVPVCMMCTYLSKFFEDAHQVIVPRTGPANRGISASGPCNVLQRIIWHVRSVKRVRL
jgi:hypothetical protein